MDSFFTPANRFHPQTCSIVCCKCDGLIYDGEGCIESFEEPDFDYDEDGYRSVGSDGWVYQHDVCPDPRIIPDDLEAEDDFDDRGECDGRAG